MQNELTCNQVIALMSFYVEDKINQKLKNYVDEHLKKCSKCREIYMQSQKITNHILSLGAENETQYLTKQYEEFKQKLSAYVDNELNEIESLKIKKISISNPLARKDLENIYSFKKLLHESFDKTRNEFKTDYSKQIVNLLNTNEDQTCSFKKVIYCFICLLSILLIGLIITLNS